LNFELNTLLLKSINVLFIFIYVGVLQFLKCVFTYLFKLLFVKAHLCKYHFIEFLFIINWLLLIFEFGELLFCSLNHKLLALWNVLSGIWNLVVYDSWWNVLSGYWWFSLVIKILILSLSIIISNNRSP